jgi:hypothetical protein
MIATEPLPLRRVMAFARRFGERHIMLAMHAAVPLGLTPELLHLIRINFVSEAPWIAEADMLLSSLCREVGGDLYEIDSEVREILLDELRSDFQPERVSQVAGFLLAYTRQHLEAGLPGSELVDFLIAQQLAALAQINPAEAARSLALALGVGLQAGDQAATLQVVNLTNALAAHLIGEDAIQLYAAGVGRIVEGEDALGFRFLDAIGPRNHAPQIGGITLPPANELMVMVRPAAERPQEQSHPEPREEGYTPTSEDHSPMTDTNQPIMEDVKFALTLLIIRHAEKPDESWPGPGLTPDGVPDGKSLVIRGWQRAGAWSALFGGGLGGTDYPAPSLIYAANPNVTTSDEPSQRSYQTVLPLAGHLGLTPVTEFSVGQESKLVSEIVSKTGVVLVAWEHKAIARDILPAIAKGESLPAMPTKWDGTRFDIVLRFDRTSPDAPWSFRQLCPCLLSGDSTNLMS